jgi:tripartite-type tricarboxylate transporter receptor subunit TctC
MVLLGAKTLQAQDASELVSWMKAKGRAVRIAHAGPWSASLECALQVQDLLETKLTLVSSANTSEALDKLQSGAVDVMCEAVPAVIESVRRGDILAFVLAADERLPALWDVATADQAGLPLFSATTWIGAYTASANATTSVSKALTDDITSKLADVGWSVFAQSYQTSDAHKQHLAAEDERRKGRLNESGLPVAP